MSNVFFKDRDGQTPLPLELQKGLKIKTIQTIGELDEHEESNVAKGLSWLLRQNSDPKNYQFWVKLHKKLFHDVWSWAGQIRQHELQNPDFLKPYEIWTRVYQLEQDVKGWISMNSFRNEEIVARFHVEIETIHPFANGNGRFGRILTNQICKYHGFKIPTWGHAFAANPKMRREKYIEAIISARRSRIFSDMVEVMFA